MAFFDIFRKKQQEAPASEEQLRKQQQELDAGLEKTKSGLFSKLARAVAGRSTVDADVLDDLEEVLITSDVGVETTVKIIRRIEERVARDKYMNTSELQRILREEITALLEEAHGSDTHFGLDAREGEPYVVMVVGVNGAGKTTTIGKLAAQLVKAGRKVWIGAADTFRAAAIDQLQVWADRAGATMIHQQMGSDPASVAYDTLTSANRHLSVDAPITDDEGAMVDLMVSNSGTSDKQLIGESLACEIERVLAKLPERESTILHMYFGIGCHETELNEIAIKLGLSRERTRQLKDRALRQLRSQKDKILKSYLG